MLLHQIVTPTQNMQWAGHNQNGRTLAIHLQNGNMGELNRIRVVEKLSYSHLERGISCELGDIRWSCGSIVKLQPNKIGDHS
jgi:hypothetical protein